MDCDKMSCEKNDLMMMSMQSPPEIDYLFDKVDTMYTPLIQKEDLEKRIRDSDLVMKNGFFVDRMFGRQLIRGPGGMLYCLDKNYHKITLDGHGTSTVIYATIGVHRGRYFVVSCSSHRLIIHSLKDQDIILKEEFPDDELLAAYYSRYTIVLLLRKCGLFSLDVRANDFRLLCELQVASAFMTIIPVSEDIVVCSKRVVYVITKTGQFRNSFQMLSDITGVTSIGEERFLVWRGRKLNVFSTQAGVGKTFRCRDRIVAVYYQKEMIFAALYNGSVEAYRIATNNRLFKVDTTPFCPKTGERKRRRKRTRY